MNYLIIDKQFLILCKFIIIGSDILFNRLCLFRRVCRLFGGFSARFTDLGANKCMPDRQFIRLHLNLCRQNTFHSANIFLYFFFHQGDVTLRFLCRKACGFDPHYPYQKKAHFRKMSKMSLFPMYSGLLSLYSCDMLKKEVTLNND